MKLCLESYISLSEYLTVLKHFDLFLLNLVFTNVASGSLKLDV